MSIHNIKVDKMRYQVNSLSFGLVMLSLVPSVISLFSIITPPAVVPTFSTGIEILLSILLLLLTFLGGEKAKAYQKKWGIALIGFAGMHLVRIFLEPLKLFKLAQLSQAQFIWIVIEIVLACVLLVVAGVITIIKHDQLMKHLKEVEN
ncbi:MAG: hypothetical protein K9L02_02250 [Acholeplasmataceae bacterium]|nr:hypothetical protein [Acholeplasmataceae bacterium]